MASSRTAAFAAALALVTVALAAAQGGPETPLDLSHCNAALNDTVSSVSQLSKLETLIRQANGTLPDLVSLGANLTFFAPSDTAIKQFNDAVNSAAGSRQLTEQQLGSLGIDILKYHTLPRLLETANMTVGQSLATQLTGRKITVTAVTPMVVLAGAAAGSNATISNPNIRVCHSIMHIIDHVLLPVPIQELATGQSAAKVRAAKPPPKAAAAAPAKAAKPGVAQPSGNTTADTASATKAAVAAAAASATEPAPAPGAASAAAATTGALALLSGAAAATLLLA